MSVVDFTLLGQRFQAITAGRHHEFNDAISIVVTCDSQEELDRYWNALIDGGGKSQADRSLRSQVADCPRDAGRDAAR